MCPLGARMGDMKQYRCLRCSDAGLNEVCGLSPYYYSIGAALASEGR